MCGNEVESVGNAETGYTGAEVVSDEAFLDGVEGVLGALLKVSWFRIRRGCQRIGMRRSGGIRTSR